MLSTRGIDNTSTIKGLKVSTVRQPSKYLVSQSINSTSHIKILGISKYRQYVNHQRTKYLKVSTVRQPSKYLVSQSNKSTSTIKILSISKYQQYVNHQRTKYRFVHVDVFAEKYYTGTYYTGRPLQGVLAVLTHVLEIIVVYSFWKI